MRILLSILACAVAIAACSGPAPETHEPLAESTPDPQGEIDQSEVNLDVWLERLEVGSRELYSAREAVVEAVGLKAGDWVADVGAGTGLYTLLFAEEVGPAGHVFAEDIEPLFLDLINRRVADADLDNVTSVLGRQEDVTLPKGAVDMVFIADTYHYFSDREAIMRSIYDALKPGGALVLVEFEIEPGAKRPDYKSHVRFGKASVLSEIEFLGFEHGEEIDVEGLEDNYFLKFEKPVR
jgi:predicted methyltransferase